MQAGILLKDGSDIKAKYVYGGDISTEKMQEIASALESAYPTFTVEIFESDTDQAFVDAVVNSPLPVE